MPEIVNYSAAKTAGKAFVNAVAVAALVGAAKGLEALSGADVVNSVFGNYAVFVAPAVAGLATAAINFIKNGLLPKFDEPVD